MGVKYHIQADRKANGQQEIKTEEQEQQKANTEAEYSEKDV